MPGGGASLDRDTVSTDNSGIVSVNVNAGTLAQLVQVRAQVVGTGIYSDLARVVIHGGLPHPAHFSFATENVNVPGIIEFGIVNRVTAFVGDRYGNPVPTGHVVYFTTTGGIIQGSATTDDHGRAAVDLITAEPLPNNLPAFSDSAGIARISIQTVGENQATLIRSERAVAFTGHTELAVSPTTFSIPLDGSQVFTVTARDREHHNPLVEGSTITLATTLGSVGGQTSIVLPDTWDPAYTTFSFRVDNLATGAVLVNPNGARVPLRSISGNSAGTALSVSSTGTGNEVAVPRTARITVTIVSRNGDASSTVYGTVEVP
jgi:hypothetical protein